MKLFLKEICTYLDIQNCKHPDVSVKGVSIDSRTLKKGDLFIALKGENFNGHDFIDISYKKGAAAVIAESRYLESKNIKENDVIIKVKNTLTALQQIAAQYRKKFDIPVIAVTGSNGKTTTKEMIAEILSSRYKTAKTRGNYNNHIGVPLSILHWDEDSEAAVMELGTNHFGEIDRLCKILQPNYGVITNIGKAHLEFFETLEGVTKAKKELVEYLKPNGYVFLNGDDPYLYPLRTVCENTVLFGFSSRCNVRGKNSRIDAEGFPSMKVRDRKVTLRIPGMHNLNNALASIAVAQSLHIKENAIYQGLEHYQPVERRMNIVYAGEIKMIDDTYNANPSSMLESLKTLKIISKKGRSIAVIGDMKELGSHSKDEHQNIGEKAFKLGIDALFCLGEMSEYVYEGALRSGMKDIYYYYDKTRLVEDLRNFVGKDDVILVKGSRSMKMEDIIIDLKSKV